MISKTMQDAINDQINKELFSEVLYLSMAADFARKNLPGISQWLRIQAGEEHVHATKFYDHLIDRDGKVELKSIAAPKIEWKTNLEAFKDALAHEQMITTSINSLYELAQKEKDYPAQVLLQWFITEQVEEEKNATEVVAHLEMIDARESAVLMLDHRLGKRS